MRRRAAKVEGGCAPSGRRFGVALLAALAFVGVSLPAATSRAETQWDYGQFPDSEVAALRHTVQAKIEYEGAAVTFAFVCARGNLVLTIVATWPIAPVLRYRFPPETAQWMSGSAPVPSSAVFQGDAVRALFATALARTALLVRIPGPRTVAEKTLDLRGFQEKSKPLQEACRISQG
jgi:hypothetical protein